MCVCVGAAEKMNAVLVESVGVIQCPWCNRIECNLNDFHVTKTFSFPTISTSM